MTKPERKFHRPIGWKEMAKFAYPALALLVICGLSFLPMLPLDDMGAPLFIALCSGVALVFALMRFLMVCFYDDWLSRHP